MSNGTVSYGTTSLGDEFDVYARKTVIYKGVLYCVLVVKDAPSGRYGFTALREADPLGSTHTTTDPEGNEWEFLPSDAQELNSEVVYAAFPELRKAAVVPNTTHDKNLN